MVREWHLFTNTSAALGSVGREARNPGGVRFFFEALFQEQLKEKVPTGGARTKKTREK